jgi:hypothetical protein
MLGIDYVTSMQYVDYGSKNDVVDDGCHVIVVYNVDKTVISTVRNYVVVPAPVLASY